MLLSQKRWLVKTSENTWKLERIKKGFWSNSFSLDLWLNKNLENWGLHWSSGTIFKTGKICYSYCTYTFLLIRAIFYDLRFSGQVAFPTKIECACDAIVFDDNARACVRTYVCVCVLCVRVVCILCVSLDIPLFVLCVWCVSLVWFAWYIFVFLSNDDDTDLWLLLCLYFRWNFLVDIHSLDYKLRKLTWTYTYFSFIFQPQIVFTFVLTKTQHFLSSVSFLTYHFYY